jgi:hypothetical protein
MFWIGLRLLNSEKLIAFALGLSLLITTFLLSLATLHLLVLEFLTSVLMVLLPKALLNDLPRRKSQ